MNKFALVLAALLTFVGIPAFAQVGSDNLTREARYSETCITYNVGAAIASVVEGTDGGIWVQSVDTACQTAVCSDTQPAMLAYPSELSYGLTDTTANDTLTCTSLTITGYDQFGEIITYFDATITETVETTGVVFSKLTRIQLSGCSNGTDATDEFVINGTDVTAGGARRIGLGKKISSYKDIESICIRDASASNALLCAPGDDGSAADLQTLLRTRVTFPIASGVTRKMPDASLDVVTTALFGGTKVAVADGDQICWRIRHGNTKP